MKIAGTGHRPDKLGGYSVEVYEAVFEVALGYLRQTKPESVISGMALGWDQALAEAALMLHIPFDAYIPFEGQERKWPVKSQRFYRALMANARTVVNCGNDDNYASWKMQVRNERMVDALDQEGDRLVALWNGDEHGGTFNCIQYAKTKDVRIVNLWGQFHG